jgi:Tat protein translocase TatB subunit
MFEIGFTELLLVGIVALIVLGPDRLPGAVRTAGLWIGRIKRSFSAIKADVRLVRMKSVASCITSRFLSLSGK